MRTDFLIDDNNDLVFENEDIVIGESTEQHQKLLLICNKGDFKETPTACVGVRSWLKDEDDRMNLPGEIKKEFERDGMTVRLIDLKTDGKLNINAYYS